MKRALLLLFCVLVWSSPGSFASAQASYEEKFASTWQAVMSKVIQIAKDFPEDHFDYRPHPDVRSFREEIWHVTSIAEVLVVAEQAKKHFEQTGERMDITHVFSYEGRPRDRAGLVAALEKAAAESVEVLEKNPNPNNLWFLEHAGEHYGKLVTMYRNLGLVPPLTRQRQEQRRRYREEMRQRQQEQKKKNPN